MSTCKNIAIFYVYAVVRTSIIFWDMKMTNIWKDIYFRWKMWWDKKIKWVTLVLSNLLNKYMKFTKIMVLNN